MPLVNSKTDAARAENIRREIAAGKDPKQAAAIAYSVQHRAQDAASAAPGAPTAAGLVLVCDGHVLLLQRASGGDAAGCWAYPGGKIEPGETAEQAAVRELREETGLSYDGPLHALGVTPGGFQAFAARVDARQSPRLNGEHTAFQWAPFDALPAPLHPHMRDQLLIAADPVGWIRQLAMRLR